MAPVVRELLTCNRFEVAVGVSAQHRAMLDQVLDLFKIKILFDLNLMQRNQDLTDVTTRVLNRLSPHLRRFRPDLVLVHGDTTTTLAGALSAFYHRIPVGHVEAGLRTRDLYRPYPEEMNRRLTDSLCALHFAPTRDAQAHLFKEGHAPHSVFVTGNSVIDALLFTRNAYAKESPSRTVGGVLNAGSSRGKIVLVTAHRRENFGRPFERIFQALRHLGARFPAVQWVYPVHPNPNVRKPARTILSRCKNIHLISPLNYGELVVLMNRASFVMTDSGGIQEEAPSLGKPVLVFRDVTERPEAVRAGTVKLVGSDPKKIILETTRLLTRSRDYSRMARAVNPYGDGRASVRIREGIEWYFKMRRSKPNPFRSRI